MAIACLRLVTFFPELPLLSVPRLRSSIAFLTFAPAALLYFRAIAYSTSRCNSWRDCKLQEHSRESVGDEPVRAPITTNHHASTDAAPGGGGAGTTGQVQLAAGRFACLCRTPPTRAAGCNGGSAGAGGGGRFGRTRSGRIQL